MDWTPTMSVWIVHGAHDEWIFEVGVTYGGVHLGSVGIVQSDRPMGPGVEGIESHQDLDEAHLYLIGWAPLGL